MKERGKRTVESRVVFMRTINAPEVWHVAHVRRYTRALARLDETIAARGSESDLQIRFFKVYFALGAPFGWRRGKDLWFRFDQWSTVN